MSEELLQRDLIENPAKIGRWDFYNIGATSVKTLKENGIIRNVDYGKEEKKKVDALIVHYKKVLAVIEYKQPKNFKTKKQQKSAVKQIMEVARKLDCNIIIATDTKETVWVNANTGNRILDQNGEELKYNFDVNDEKLPPLIEKVNYSVNELNDRLKPIKLVKPTDLANQIWQDIWAVSGATPENCLYTFVELFIFKYLSDLGVLSEGINFSHLLDRYSYNIENPNEEALEYYAGVIRPKIKELFPSGPDGTTIINGTIFVSKDQKAVKGYSTVFKKVLLKFKNYGKLEHIDVDFKSQLFESFLKESISKKNWGQFFTPLKVVRAIVEMTKEDIKEGIKICDPACGVGKFLLEPLMTKLDYLYEINGNKITPKITIHGFDKGFDRDEQKTIILAKANMLIYFSDILKDNPSLTSSFSNLINESFTLKTNSILGTLSETIEDEYDLILTNPPYVTSGSSNLKEEIKKDGELEKFYKVNALGVEGLFMEWIIRALKPGGKAYIIVPDGILNRQHDRNLRKFIKDECYIDAIISLPLNTFFTTNKKTYILCVTKKQDKLKKQTDPVFTYLVSEIGESRDVYRFDIDQDDLSEAVTLYSFFRGGDKKKFSKINKDERCKIQPIETFDPDNHWSVDRWWSEEERVNLGIVEEKDVIDPLEFSNIVNEISLTLNEYSNLLKELTEKKKSIDEHKSISLSNKKYFKLFIGKRLLKRDLRKIKDGHMPVFSANVSEPIAYHKKSNISDFNNDFVLWGIDGDFKFNYIKKNNPFVTTDHCGAIRILDEKILPQYLMIQLDIKKHQYGFDRGLRASLKNMKSVEIEIPFTENGNIDIIKQHEVIEKFECVQDLKIKVSDYLSQIDSFEIELHSDEFKTAEFMVCQLFELETGNSKYTRKYGNSNKGDYPVYSASNNDPLTFIDTYDYDGKFLTWSTNGFAGYIKLISGKFSINADRGLLKPKFDNLNHLFIKKTLEPLLRDVAKGRKGDMGKDEFTKVYPSMVKDLKIQIPINKNGDPDPIAQNYLASKYQQIDDFKVSIKKELNKIESTRIYFN